MLKGAKGLGCGDAERQKGNGGRFGEGGRVEGGGLDVFFVFPFFFFFFFGLLISFGGRARGCSYRMLDFLIPLPFSYSPHRPRFEIPPFLGYGYLAIFESPAEGLALSDSNPEIYPRGPSNSDSMRVIAPLHVTNSDPFSLGYFLEIWIDLLECSLFFRR